MPSDIGGQIVVASTIFLIIASGSTTSATKWTLLWQRTTVTRPYMEQQLNLIHKGCILRTSKTQFQSYLLLKYLAPINFLLHLSAPNSVPFWQNLFHREETGPKPLSLKLADSGHTPESTLAMITSCPKFAFVQSECGAISLLSYSKPRNLHECIVCILLARFTNTDNTYGCFERERVCSSSRLAAKTVHASCV